MLGRTQNYNLATFQRDASLKQSTYILNSSAITKTTQAFFKQFDLLGSSGVSLRQIGSCLNADYNINEPTDRQSALDQLVSDVDQAANDYRLMTKGANARLLPLCDMCTDLPLTSMGFDCTDESVPFLQMVLSGHVYYAASPRNLDGNRDYTMLDMAATACGITYQLCYNDDSSFNDMRENTAYSLDYSYWKSDLIQTAGEYQQQLDGLGGSEILRYDLLGSQCSQTLFANGTRVLVNRSSADQTVTLPDGKEILLKAMSYQVR
jgi:hypothetical protein